MSDPRNTITVKVNGLTHGGSFIGEILDTDIPQSGKKAFVRDVISGETVKAEIISEEKRFLHARMLEILEPSPGRIAPVCPKFGVCGGCDLQHIELQLQRQQKMEMVLSTLKFQGGGIQPLNQAVFLGSDLNGFNYRRKASFHIDREGNIGFFKPMSTDVVDTDYCCICSEEINAGLQKLRSISKTISEYVGGVSVEDFNNKLFYVFKIFDNVSFKESSQILLDQLIPLFDNFKISQLGKKLLEFTDGSKADANDLFPSGHFSQVNAEANQILIDTVLKHVDNEIVDDFYAGSGNLSFPLTEKVQHVNAIEVDAALVQYGRRKVRELNLADKITFFALSCENYLKQKAPSRLVILDPPRSGAKTLMPALCDGGTEKIIYVSCSLPSLCRDLKTLKESNFILQDLYLLDMFPQTHHIETIAVLQR